MEQISYTYYPEEQPSLLEWMEEFKVGRMAPKPDNGRAKQMMDMWSEPKKKYFDQPLVDSILDRIFRS